jgi:hypothetical protein
MFRGSVLLVALVFSTPVLWQALVTQSVGLDTAVIRFLIAIPVAALLVGGVRLAGRRRGRTPVERAPVDS